MKNRRWNYALAAWLAAGTFSYAWSIEPPVPNVPIASADASAKMKGADERLADKVVKALNADPSLKGARVTVLVTQGVVTLSGTAPNGAKADKIRKITAKNAKEVNSDSLRVAAG